ncbi:hypothetical protein H6P81_008777 [Aristolochia fimbriata]|uniref:Uncharacterized protein n=1 Tax=Aristolochia fimbriata TaxID=158543 RepID=A0AAV7EMI8_ARIFI|nr:hypothetical protein H6P81_008777 [Aristolochia fimbriata]
MTYRIGRGPRERVPPLPQIMTCTLPLGEMLSLCSSQVQWRPQAKATSLLDHPLTPPRRKGRMGLLHRGRTGLILPPNFLAIAAVLLVATSSMLCVTESRALLHYHMTTSQGFELQRRHGRELLGSRSSEISQPAPEANPNRRKDEPLPGGNSPPA